MDRITDWIVNHTLVLVLVGGAVFAFLWLLFFRKRLRLNGITVLALSVLHVGVWMISVSLFAAIENPKDYNLGMVSIFGGVFFMPIAYWAGAKLTKRDEKVVFDVFLICLLFTLMCSRFNCLYSGCCGGKIIPGTSGLCWPTRESEIVFYIVLMAIFAPKVLKGGTNGELYPIYMIAYGVFRFINETLRVANGNSIFHVSHIWAAICFCIGLCVFYEQRRKKMKVRRKLQ